MKNSHAYSFSILVLFLAFVGSFARTFCRCENSDEKLYRRRKSPEEMGRDVRLDRVGYYIIDGTRVLPRVECPWLQRRGSTLPENKAISSSEKTGGGREHSEPHFIPVYNEKDSYSEAETNAIPRSIFSHHRILSFWDTLFTRRGTNQAYTFPCDPTVVASPPAGSSLPEDGDRFFREAMKQEIFVLDNAGHLSNQTRSNGFVSIQDVDCETLPLSVRLHPRALPYHCRCPANVPGKYLPPYCADYSP